MSNLSKTYNLTKKEYTEKYFEILNVMLPTKLTENEIRIITAFILLPQDKFSKYERFSSRARKQVIKDLATNYDWTISNYSLNNFVAKLRTKNIIYKQSDGLDFIQKNILAGLEGKETTITFNFKLKA